jgi:hypothetical protein
MSKFLTYVHLKFKIFKICPNFDDLLLTYVHIFAKILNICSIRQIYLTICSYIELNFKINGEKK